MHRIADAPLFIDYLVEHDIRLLVCHEPTFWNHLDERPANDAGIQEKLKFNNHLKGLRAEHLPHGSTFQLIGT